MDDTYQNIFAITPSDDAALESVAHALYVGTAGHVKITTPAGQDITLNNLAAGVVHKIAAIKVFATGTTALTIMGLRRTKS
jgi:hypothetical protein